MSRAEEPISFGPLLRQYRIEAGLTQETLAERTGLGVRSIQHLEGGAHLPHRETVGRLIKGLGITGDDRTHFERSAQPSPRQRDAQSLPAAVSRDDHAVPRDNLPAQLTSFVGRERELAEVGRLFGSTRLLTITGVGGTGKTRLALQFATSVLDTYADGAWFVDLAPLVDPALVPQTVAGAIGVVEQSDEPIKATLRRVLRDRQLLLILDNCEHLIDACAQLTDALLRVCPRLQILATSREALGIAGEVTWSLPSLPVPTVDWQAAHRGDSVVALSDFAAIRLFVDRARAADPSFQVTNQNIAAVVQICRRVDGIPLAIELAAARVKVFSVERISGRLDDLFRLLTGGSRTALPRQQTLKATIDWSHDLLTEPERLLFRRLSVFVGSCPYEAIEAVCSGAGIDVVDVPDLLTRLVERSLVVVEREDHDRYRLPETIRQYGRDRILEAAEVEAVRDRHRDWFLQFAERAKPELIGPDQVSWLDRLEREHDNLRAALEWTLEHGPAILGLRLAGAVWRLWFVHEHFVEGREWLARVLAAPDSDIPTTARAEALGAACELANYHGAYVGDYVAAQPFAEESLAIYRGLDDRPGIARAMWLLAQSAFRVEDHARAEQIGVEALAVAREAGASWVVAQILGILSFVAERRGDGRLALHLGNDGLAIMRELGDRRAVGASLTELGWMYCYQGDNVTARVYLEEGLDIARELRSRVRIAAVLLGLGITARNEGDYAQARAHFDECLTLAKDNEFRGGTGWVLFHLGSLAHAEGDAGRAEVLVKESLSRFRDLILWPEATVAICFRGVLTIERGNQRQGAHLLGAAGSKAGHSPWLGPDDWRHYEDALTTARAILGNDEFARAWSEGQAMTLEQAIAYALEDEPEANDGSRGRT